MGYSVVSVSGGEPFMYPGLGELLTYAKSRGLRTTVTTNGYFLKHRWLEPMRDVIDTVAVSLDGPPEMHNEMRGSPKAFDKLSEGLCTLRALQIPFGVIHTVTSRSWQHLPWIAEFASLNGAKLLQLHPLELWGRAQGELRGESTNNEALSRVYLLSFVLASPHNPMRIQCDLLHRQHVLTKPELIYAAERQPDWQNQLPANLLSLLILEPDGAVVPVSYGFSRNYQLCNVQHQRLSAAWPNFVANRYPEFRMLCRRLFDDIVEEKISQLFNWYEEIVQRSNLPALVELTA
jgi:sulfatase maturation enzyme AslB (radical SAM superfamily)